MDIWLCSLIRQREAMSTNSVHFMVGGLILFLGNENALRQFFCVNGRRASAKVPLCDDILF